MQIKDIVNRDVVNLTNCEHEPIHVPGSIQPHGFLLALSASGDIIEFCSANTALYINLTHEQLLGKTLAVAFGGATAQLLYAYLQTSFVDSAPLTLHIGEAHLSCTAHANNGVYILELEPVASEQLAITDIYRQTKQFTAYMQNATTLQALCQAVTSETRAITGYDRVMVYKFDEQFNGEVFAESCNENVEPFFGLHYPHTDIPAQARELYIKNLLRLIADVNYAPVPIYTIDDAPGKTLDLSRSVLRSVSPIHVQYLHNMGVGATLTISLLHEGRLWGLIACHHYSPKYITMHTRIAAQLQGHFLTSQISVRQFAEEYTVARNVNTALEVLMHQVFSSQSVLFDKLVLQPELLQLTNAEGVAILVDDELYVHGNVPSATEVRALAEWLHSSKMPDGYSTHKLVEVFSNATQCSDASGIIFHSLGSRKTNCIIWFRPETLKQVNWGGDPQKAIIKNEKGLSPRKSFALWQEVKKCESLPWQKPELVAASNFANASQKHVHMLFLSQEELKQRRLSERLQEANAELENINWIGSHDLKEPLRKIQMFASRILEDEQVRRSFKAMSAVHKMSESAERMQSLVTDVMAYSKLKNIQESVVKVNLNTIVFAVTREVSFEIEDKGATVEIGELPEIMGIPFLLQQLFTNLLLNSLKFSKDGVGPQISVLPTSTIHGTVNVDGTEYYHILISDNGIGFDNQYNEHIFKVFSRLHAQEHYKGTGIGLALCNKIMKNHNGWISAIGKEGEGAVFNLYFPVNTGLPGFSADD